MSSGLARQMKGFASQTLYSPTKRLIAAWRSPTEWKTPCLSRRLVSLAKKPSTAFNHEHEIGVKWNVQRGWWASHAWTFSCLSAA